MSSSGNPLVYVILPVHNRLKITRAFVECLNAQTYANRRLVLIDDGSRDGTAEAVKACCPDLVLIQGPGDWWWGGSLQQAHLWFQREGVPGDALVLVMNDDTWFAPDFIETGVRILANHSGTLLTATGFNVKTGAAQDSGGYILDWKTLGFSETYDPNKMNCASTRGLLARVSDFLDVGGFYPRLLPHYLSDLEFTMRAQKRGKSLLIHPDFKIGIDFETTGTREIGGEGFREYCKKVFSNRAAMNPVHWTAFVLLHSPKKYVYLNLKRIWGGVYQEGIRARLLPELRQKIRN